MTVQPTRDQLLDQLDRAEHRIARLEAQTDIRGRAVVMYRERAREAETRIRDLTQEVKDERGAALDQMEQVRVRDARIERLENRAASETARANAWRNRSRIMAEKRDAAHSAWLSENEARREAESRLDAVRDALDGFGKPTDRIGGLPDAIRRALDT